VTGERKKAPDDLDARNKRAPHVNPENSGIRSGNPQFDPDRAGKEKAASHSPSGRAGTSPRSDPSED
jgi:hypothetical protein